VSVQPCSLQLDMSAVGITATDVVGFELSNAVLTRTADTTVRMIALSNSRAAFSSVTLVGNDNEGGGLVVRSGAQLTCQRLSVLNFIGNEATEFPDQVGTFQTKAGGSALAVRSGTPECCLPVLTPRVS
jgi:hypothetical protein